LSGIFLTLVFFRASPVEMWRAISTIDAALIPLAVALYFLSMLWRTLRWKVILQPLGNFTPLRIWPIVMIGYAVNNVLPAMAAARPVVASQIEGYEHVVEHGENGAASGAAQCFRLGANPGASYTRPAA
jgi:uncharacterized protein (TIRG00374 family)